MKRMLSNGSDGMIKRALSRRLERLETRALPVGEPLVIQVVFVSPGGTRQDGPVIKVPAPPREIAAGTDVHRRGRIHMPGGPECDEADEGGVRHPIQPWHPSSRSKSQRVTVWRRLQ